MNPDPAAVAEVDAAMAEAQEGREFEQPYVDPAEALKELDHRALVVCDTCRTIVEDKHDDRHEWVTPCPNCGGETATYSPRCGVEGCPGFAYALMPSIGSRCKPHWRKLKREAERANERPGARGRKHGSNKKRSKRR